MWKLVTKKFNQFMRKNKLTDGRMLKVVSNIEKGLDSTGLGKGVFSARIARPYEGSSGGYRSGYTYRLDDRIIFMAGFARNHQNRFTARELDALQDLARCFLAFNEDEIQKTIRTKILRVIEN